MLDSNPWEIEIECHSSKVRNKYLEQPVQLKTKVSRAPQNFYNTLRYYQIAVIKGILWATLIIVGMPAKYTVIVHLSHGETRHLEKLNNGLLCCIKVALCVSCYTEQSAVSVPQLLRNVLNLGKMKYLLVR